LGKLLKPLASRNILAAAFRGGRRMLRLYSED